MDEKTNISLLSGELKSDNSQTVHSVSVTKRITSLNLLSTITTEIHICFISIAITKQKTEISASCKIPYTNTFQYLIKQDVKKSDLSRIMWIF